MDLFACIVVVGFPTDGIMIYSLVYLPTITLHLSPFHP
jgi:hypothetical protein